MNPTFTFVLKEWSLSVRKGSDWQHFASGQTRWPYRSVPEAAEEALRMLANTRNLSTVADAIARLGDVEVAVEGHRREVDVFLMHWHLVHGAAEATLDKVRRVESVRGPSVYEVFGFGAHWPHLAEIRELAALWRLLSARSAVIPHGDGLLEHDRKAIEEERPRVGIIGVTGCGKSMLINALLRRRVLSSSAGNSTACVTELRYCGTGAEGVTVTPRPRELIDVDLATRRRRRDLVSARIAGGDLRRTVVTSASGHDEWQVTHDESRAAAQHELDRIKYEIDGLEGALRLEPGRRYPLSELERLTNIERSAVVLGVEKATVHLCSPVLERVVLVDTPGTQDPDENRKRVAVRETANLHAWIYLLRADQAPTDPVIVEWSKLVTTTAAGKPQGQGAAIERMAIVMTMLDREASGTQPLGEVLTERERTYRWYLGRAVGQEHGLTGRQVEFYPCAAEPALLAATEPIGWSEKVLPIIKQTFCGVENQSPSRLRSIRNRLEALEEEPSIRTTLADYVLDVCRVVHVGAAIAHVSQRSLVAAGSGVGASLLRRLEEACRVVEERVADDEAQRARWSSAAALEEVVTDQRKGLAEKRQVIQARERELHALEEGAMAKARALHKLGRDQSAGLVPSRGDHDRWVEKHGRTHLLWGECRFSVLDLHDKPLDRELKALILELVCATRDKLQDMLEEPSAKKGLAERAASLLLGWTLIPQRNEVSEAESLLELKSTALARLYEKTLRECATSCDRMNAAASDKAVEIVGSLIAFARNETLPALAAGIASREEEISVGTARIDELRRGVDAEASVLDERIAGMRAVLGEVVDLRRRARALPGCSSEGEEPQPVAR